MSRKLALACALLALARPVSAQITIPYPLFTAGTVISPTQVNANNTALASNALNRTGGTMTGHLLFSNDNTYDIGSYGATRPRDLHVGRNALFGGTLGVGVSPAYRVDIADATANGRGINVLQTATSGTTYGLVSVASGASTVNIAGLFSASGAGTNWAVYAPLGNGHFGGSVGIGATTFPGLLTFAEGTTAAGGIYFGADTNLYRSAANTLKTDDSLTVENGLTVNEADAELVAAFTNTGSATGSDGIAIQTTSTADGTVGLRVCSGDCSTDAFVVLASGKVYFDNLGTTASAANAFLDSAASNQLLRSTSSARFKSDIHSLTRGLDVVLGLRPVTYTARDKPAGPRYPGFIAEEVAPIEPILVTRDAQGRPDYVQYDRVTAYLVNAVQELSRRVERLEAELAHARKQ